MKQEQIWKFWKSGRREGTYFEVSNTGHVLKHYKNGTTNMCCPFLKKPQIRMGHSPVLYVKVDYKDMNLARIVYEVWHGMGQSIKTAESSIRTATTRIIIRQIC